MALISVVYSRLVEGKKILPSSVVSEMVGFATLLPGPVAVNVVAAIGYYLKGWRGMIAAFMGILLPAFLSMFIFYYLYQNFNVSVYFLSFFKGTIGVIVSIIIVAGYSMIKNEKLSVLQILIMFFSFSILFFFNSYGHLLVILLSAGTAGWIFNNRKYESISQKRGFGWFALLFLLGISGIIYLLPGNSIYFDLAKTFISISLSLFGGGYVVIPMLQDVIVVQKGWLSQQEFMDSITLGQITPGPILISAAFVGFKQGGLMGGIIATVSIFAPSAAVMVLSYSYLKQWLGNRHVRAILDGLRMAIVAMIFYSAISLFMQLNNSFISVLTTIISLFLLFSVKLNVIYLILAGGIISIIYHFASLNF